MQVTYRQHCGDDLMVVDAARVSFAKQSEWEPLDPYDPYPSEFELSERDQRLIKFLAREGHYSPFNHTFLTMHVSAPVFVARQLVKHKFMPWNEVSGRYVTFDPKFHMPSAFREKAADKKQGSGDPITRQPAQTDLQLIFIDQHKDSFRRYQQALAHGLCEEQARGLLPLNLMTEWYWSGTLGAWASMYNLRAKPDAQEETQVIARQAGEIIKPLFSVSWEALTCS